MTFAIFLVYLAFLVLSVFFVLIDAQAFGLPMYDLAAKSFFSYPIMAFNVFVGAYLVHYFMLLDDHRYRVFLLMFFVSLSVMIGSGASLILETKIADTDYIKLAFGDGPMFGVAMFIATWGAGWSARQFHKSY